MSPVVSLRTRRSRLVTVFVAAVVVTFCVLTVTLFVYPDLDAPRHADAIVALSGSGHRARDEAITLAEKGGAPVLALSVVSSRPCPPRLPQVPAVTLRCFRPDPVSTRGEARAIAHLAARYHWHRIIVVMPVPQVTRARLRIGRCYPGQVLEVGVEPAGAWQWAREIVYEWGALAKAIVIQPTC